MRFYQLSLARSAGDCPGCWWGLRRYGGALGIGPHQAGRAVGAGTVSRSGGRLGVVRPTPRPPVRAAPSGAALHQHLPPLPHCPGAGRPAALAADGRLPEIAPDFPPGLFHAWAAQTSPLAVPCPGTVATPGPYVLPQLRRPPSRGAIKKTSPPAGSAAGGPGPLAVCDRIPRLTAWVFGGHRIRFLGCQALAALPAF